MYETYIKEFQNVLEKAKTTYLSTANKQGIIDTCQMCIVNDGLTVYFQTDETFEKVKNIKENPYVAFGIGNYYFKGKAKIVSNPSDNRKFTDKMKEKHLKSYNAYTHLPSEVLIEVELFEVKCWDKSDNNSILTVNLKTKEVKKIVCDRM